MHLSKLVKLLSPVHSVVKWGGCSILSSLPMEEVEVRPREMVAGLPGRRSYHPRFTTARVQVQEDRQALCCTSILAVVVRGFSTASLLSPSLPCSCRWRAGRLW